MLKIRCTHFKVPVEIPDKANQCLDSSVPNQNYRTHPSNLATDLDTLTHRPWQEVGALFIGEESLVPAFTTSLKMYFFSTLWHTYPATVWSVCNLKFFSQLLWGLPICGSIALHKRCLKIVACRPVSRMPRAIPNCATMSCLKKISGMPGCGTFPNKGVTRPPSFRTVMRSLHFTADNYKVGMEHYVPLQLGLRSLQTYMLPPHSRKWTTASRASEQLRVGKLIDYNVKHAKPRLWLWGTTWENWVPAMLWISTSTSAFRQNRKKCDITTPTHSRKTTQRIRYRQNGPLPAKVLQL